jgi:hypothetical protein
MKIKIDPELIASCGMNCAICVGFFGYAVNGRKRKEKCIGCRKRNKNCTFLKKGCDKLTKNKVTYCFECDDFPCENLKKLDKRYKERYDMSMIENLKNIRDKGMEFFLKQQEKKYKCKNCIGLLCVHTKECYFCKIN